MFRNLLVRISQIRILDQKFAENKFRYIAQCILTTLALLPILMILDIFSSLTVIASFGASSFIAFTMPHAQVSRPRFMIGGYIMGIIAGTSCHGLSKLIVYSNHIVLESNADIIFSALAVGLAIFLMVITDTEHPPAAGIALSLVMNEWNMLIVSVILLGILLISSLKALLKPSLINLL